MNKMNKQEIKLFIINIVLISIALKVGTFLGSLPNLYYLLTIIVLFIFWYGFFELLKK